MDSKKREREREREERKRDKLSHLELVLGAVLGGAAVDAKA